MHKGAPVTNKDVSGSGERKKVRILFLKWKWRAPHLGQLQISFPWLLAMLYRIWKGTCPQRLKFSPTNGFHCGFNHSTVVVWGSTQPVTNYRIVCTFPFLGGECLPNCHNLYIEKFVIKKEKKYYLSFWFSEAFYSCFLIRSSNPQNNGYILIQKKKQSKK